MSDALDRGNPDENEDCMACYFCQAKGCFCSVDHGNDAPPEGEECVCCDVCEGSGQLSREELDVMAEKIQEDDGFDRGFHASLNAIIILLAPSSLLFGWLS